ncbi:hypothetical protein LJR296_008170 [Cupriavidus necator]|uniref:hypothetical protein n=1 Tax=Cupriavidus necator TaxID=106590 RepID=UPI003ECC792A
MAYVLVWLAGTAATYVGDFQSLSACQDAARRVIEVKKELGANYDPRAALCLPKGQQ